MDQKSGEVNSETAYDLEKEKNIEYELVEQEVDVSGNNNVLEFTDIIPAGKTIKITIKAKLDEVLENTDVENYCTVNGNYIKSVDSNTIKFTIVPQEENKNTDTNSDTIGDNDETEQTWYKNNGDDRNSNNNKDDEKDNSKDNENNKDDENKTKDNNNSNDENGNNVVDAKYNTISGIVWIDKNADGKRDTNEETLSGIKVRLFDFKQNALSKDEQGNQRIVTTDESGKYKFSNVPNGLYLVLFEYDLDKYELTKYQESNVSDDLNSDVTQKEINIDGQSKKIGMTDVISIDGKDVSNIDMGLKNNLFMDLSLKKYVSKISVTTDSGTKDYSYNNSQIAKVEIPRKQIDSASVTIEYKIIITNEGNADTYVSEVVDYLPEGLTLSNDTENWIYKSNGYVSNTSLSGGVLSAGQSKELILTATKLMDSNNTGIVVNAAEISKAKNNYNLSDIDSTYGNKNENEDDYSEANVIISIKTGVVRNTIIIVLILVVLTLILYFLKIKNKKLMIVLLMLFVGINVINGVRLAAGGSGLIEIHGVGLYKGSDNKYHYSYYQGSDGHTYKCASPGFAQCARHAHYYEKISEKTTTSGLKTTKLKNPSVESLEVGTIASNGQVTATFSTGSNAFTSSSAIVKYKLEGESGWKTLESSKYSISANTDKKGGTVNITLPTGATKVKVKVSAKFADVILKTRDKETTYLYKCVRLGSDGHCTRPSKVQKMKRTEKEHEENKEPATKSKTVTTDLPEPGDIRIIKVDVDTGELLQNVEFVVYYIDEDGNKQYVQSESGAETTTFAKTEKNLTVDSKGEYLIKNISVDEEYYFEEKKTANSNYLLSANSDTVELNISEKQIDENTALKRALKYVLKQKSVRDTVLKYVDENDNGLLDTAEKGRFSACYATLIAYDSWGNGEYNLLDFLGNYLESKNILKSNIPTADEADKLVDFLIKDYEERAHSTLYKKLFEEKDYFASTPISIERYLKLKILEDKKIYSGKDGNDVFFKDVATCIVDSQYEYALAYFNKETPNMIENESNLGYVRIQKRDFDTEELIRAEETEVHAKFKFENKDPDADAAYKEVIVEVDTNGEVIVPLEYGEYEVSEIGAPTEYKLDLQVNTTQIIDISRTDKEDGMYEMDVYNRKYGDLYLRKVDENTENTYLEDLKFKDAEFKIYIYDQLGAKKYIKSYKKGEPSDVEFTTYDMTSAEEATSSLSSNRKEEIGNSAKAQACTFKTNENGVVIDEEGNEGLINIPQYYKYYVEEVNLPEQMKQYYDISNATLEVEMLNNYDGTKTNEKFKNRQLRVDLQGLVWEDIVASKEGVLNSYCAKDLHDELDEYTDNKDMLIEGIPVTLKKDDVKIAERTTNSEGVYFFPAKGKYNADGTGTDYTIDLFENETDKLAGTNVGKGLSHYTIEFEYNGLKYQCVAFPQAITKDTYWSREESSKASETSADRDEINNDFNVIQGGNVKGTQTQGSTGTGVGLTYDSGDNYDSLLVDKTSYTTDTLDGYVSPIEKASIIASTATSEFDIQSKWSIGTRTIRNINLGIYKRAQPDLAVSVDLDNIELNINNYYHKYNAGKRSSYLTENEYQFSEADLGYETILDGFSVAVKKTNDGYRNLTYERGIYESYIAYTKMYQPNPDRLRVYLTYKIAVKNESSLYSKVSLKNYADSRLSNIVESNYRYGDSKGSVTWSGDSEKSTSDEIDAYIKPGEIMYVYVKYELPTTEVIQLAEYDTYAIDKFVTEINTYSTYTDTLEKYGGIDNDSAPNNINVDDSDTYEDDTDIAPDLTLWRKNNDDSRQIKGMVFEDNPLNIDKEKLNSGKERNGNGQYDSGENGVENVEVRLVLSNDNTGVSGDYDTDPQPVNLYYLEGAEAKSVPAKTNTDADGIYNFKGLIPGEYYIQYKYGKYKDDGGSLVQTKINGNDKVTTQSYKSTIVNIYEFNNLIENNIEDMSKRSELGNPYKDNGSALYWYRKQDSGVYTNTNNSSAVDNSNIRRDINDHLKNIDYNTKSRYESRYEDASVETEDTMMKAYTGYLDWAIEDYKDRDNMNIDDPSEDNGYEVKFGIIERPRQSLKLEKEISRLSIILANGNTLAQGDPRDEKSMNYVTYPKGGRLKIEIDNEIIQGANLGLRYEIRVKNYSEIDYNNRNYYRYGKCGRYGNDITYLVKIDLDAIVDYVDEKLQIKGLVYDQDKFYKDEEFVYNYTADNGRSKWEIITNLGTNNLSGIALKDTAYDLIKNRKNVVVLKPNNNSTYNEIKTIGPKIGDPDGGDVATYSLTTEKLLTNLKNNDQIFDNIAELIQVSNPVGRFYGEMSEDKWTLRTPGNFEYKLNADNKYDSHEADDNDHIRAQTVIVPPTGSDERSIRIYSIIGLGVLVITLGGLVIFIKRKKSK